MENKCFTGNVDCFIVGLILTCLLELFGYVLRIVMMLRMLRWLQGIGLVFCNSSMYYCSYLDLSLGQKQYSFFFFFFLTIQIQVPSVPPPEIQHMNENSSFWAPSPMDRGAWWATVPGVAESDTTEWLTPLLFHSH